MKQLFLTLALALTAFASKAQQPQMDTDNQSGSNWLVEFYLDDPNGSPNAFHAVPILLPSTPIVFYLNSLALSWEDQNGNPIPATSLPSGVQWGMIRIWNPCGVSGMPGMDIISLNTGITGQLPRIFSDNAGISQTCTGVIASQVTGQIFLPGAPGHVNLQIH